MLRDANVKIDRLRCAADLLISAEFVSGSAADKSSARNEAALKVAVHFNDSDLETFRMEAQSALARQVTFHWPLEFPEVMVERGGFDAFVGNPPFINAIDGDTPDVVKTWLRGRYKHLSGTADSSYYFVTRIHETTLSRGTAGLILPRAFLNASSSVRLRTDLQATRPPTMIYCPDGLKLFHSANVRIVAISLVLHLSNSHAWGVRFV